MCETKNMGHTVAPFHFRLRMWLMYPRLQCSRCGSGIKQKRSQVTAALNKHGSCDYNKTKWRMSATAGTKTFQLQCLLLKTTSLISCCDVILGLSGAWSEMQMDACMLTMIKWKEHECLHQISRCTMLIFYLKTNRNMSQSTDLPPREDEYP